MSVPGLRGFVERPQHIEVIATALNDSPIELESKEFPAAAIQHEFVHLDGTLYVDRITDSSKLMIDDELERYHAPRSQPP